MDVKAKNIVDIWSSFLILAIMKLGELRKNSYFSVLGHPSLYYI
jgi:hypothetical protein